MIRKECPSYPISIFMAGDCLDADILCDEFCNEVGFCVTVARTRYIYRNCPPNEDGVVIGLINYPRFPMTPEQLWARAEDLAERLRVKLKQESYSIQAPDKTVWISHRQEPTP